MNYFDSIEKLSVVKKIIFVPILLIALCLLGYLLLVLVYCIPENLMDSKMQTSSCVFQQEGAYPRLTNHENSQLDNFTDSLMLLTASHSKSENVWKSAVYVSHYVADNKNPCETMLYIYQENGSVVQDSSYPRYWHGYLVFLKPLLVFCSYPTIRYIMMFLQLGLFMFLVIKLAERNKILIFPVFLSWIFLNPMVTMLSLQYNSMLIVSFLAMLFLLYQEERWKNSLYIYGLFFLVVGAVTSYLDLLTYPLITLGFPLVLWLSLNYSDNMRENLKRILYYSVFWAIGYCIMWGSKWILGSIVTGENIIKNAADAICFRTSSSVYEQSFSFLDVLVRQFEGAYQITWPVLTIILVVLLFFKGIKLKKGMFYVLIPCLLISFYPMVWYVVLKNHSYIHYWFTYRELGISLYAFITFAMIYIGGGGEA